MPVLSGSNVEHLYQGVNTSPGAFKSSGAPRMTGDISSSLGIDVLYTTGAYVDGSEFVPAARLGFDESYEGEGSTVGYVKHNHHQNENKFRKDLYNGVIEPFNIRDVINFTKTDGLIVKRSIKGTLQAGNSDSLNRTSTIQQLYRQNSATRLPIFLDREDEGIDFINFITTPFDDNQPNRVAPSSPPVDSSPQPPVGSKALDFTFVGPPNINFKAASNASLDNDGTVPFAISAWIERNFHHTNGAIAGKSGSPFSIGWELGVHGGDTGWTPYLWIGETAGAGLVYSEGDTPILTTDEWVHIYAVYTGTGNASGNITIYINGAAETMTHNSYTLDPSESASNTAYFTIGCTSFEGYFSELKTCEVGVWWNDSSPPSAADVYNEGLRHGMSSMSNPPDYYWPVGITGDDDTDGVGEIQDVGDLGANIDLLANNTDGTELITDGPAEQT